MSIELHLFAGPSMYGSAIRTQCDSAVRWLPPVKRGDIARICDGQKEPGVIAIADGTFHSYPSVSHEEIREAMELGWHIFGLCSMGAIRAAEMWHLGMIPFGKVASLYCAKPDTPDDEVCLLHESTPPYKHLSEPLVHIREFMSFAVSEGALAANQANDVLATLSNLWYGHRTLGAVEREMLARMDAAEMPGSVEKALTAFDRFRLKQQDLLSFINLAPWRHLQRHRMPP